VRDGLTQYGLNAPRQAIYSRYIVGAKTNGFKMTMANTLRALAAALLLSAAMTVATSVKSQTVQRISAIVNDELITAYDLESRIRLVIFSTRLSNTVDTRRRISSQVLRTLIDERLQMQEAKLRNISVSRRDLQRARETIEKQNRLPKGGLESVLQQNGIPFESINEQLRTSIAWSKLIGRRLRPRITIGEDEIDESLERIRSRQGQTEYRLSEILLTVDSPDQEANIRRTHCRSARRGRPLYRHRQTVFTKCDGRGGGRPRLAT
jgi:peptidyl-prolyl cis-trans isomerase SurA